MRIGVRAVALSYRRHMSSYRFEDFRRDVLWRVRILNRTLQTPEDSWPGVLILDVKEGLSATAFDLAPELRTRLVERLLPEAIRASRARRFAWVMPGLRRVGDVNQECLLLVIGERGRVEATLADIIRHADGPPRLGRYRDGPFGSGARRVSGRFVDALLSAMEPED